MRVPRPGEALSYLAIARKYRPATFDEIVGQDHVTRTLRNAIERDRIHHAFLFTGARGVGKTTAARALARSLNCTQGPTADPCGVCLSCTEITAGMSPDLIEIDGASNNSVDDVRELRETVRYAPTRGKWKIYLVDEVHMLSKGAFNALLKTLEEPPSHVVFIFATTEANKIPETILSRVQRFDFKRIPVAGVVERLRTIAEREGASLSDHALRLIARAGEGSMRDAQSLLDQVIAYAGPAISDEEVIQALGLVDRSLLYDTLEGLITGQPDKALDAIDHVYRYGYELSQFTSELLEVLRNATFLRLSEGARRHVDLAPGDVARLEGLTQDVDPEVLTRVFSALIDVHDQVSRASRPRMVLEMAVARLATIRPLEPVGALLGRLEGLERRIRQGGGSPPGAGLAAAPRGASDAHARARAPQRSPAPAPRVGQSAQSARQPAPPRRAVPPSDDDSDQGPPPAPPYEDVPTFDDVPPPSAPHAAPPAAPAPRDEGPIDPWARVRAAAGERSAALDPVKVSPGEGTLRLIVPTVRAQVALARLLERPEVADALRRGYPDSKPEIVFQKPPEAETPEETLRRQALEHPAVRRIMDALGADLVNVSPLDDGESR